MLLLYYNEFDQEKIYGFSIPEHFFGTLDRACTLLLLPYRSKVEGFLLLEVGFSYIDTLQPIHGVEAE